MRGGSSLRDRRRAAARARLVSQQAPSADQRSARTELRHIAAYRPPWGRHHSAQRDAASPVLPRGSANAHEPGRLPGHGHGRTPGQATTRSGPGPRQVRQLVHFCPSRACCGRTWVTPLLVLERGAQPMILPKVRDPRFVMICRGGTLTDSDHHLLALWAASCAEHVVDLFESAQPDDPRPREGSSRPLLFESVTNQECRG